MLYGHTASALLAPEYQKGTWFDIWVFQRGLTSTLFLLLGGFAFSIATSRRWASHIRWSRALFKRIRRFALFVVLGYALHFPASRFADLPSVDAGSWRTFLAVDVLQLIGVSFIAVQLLVLVSRTRQTFTIVALTLAVAIVVLTPYIWSLDWPHLVPGAVAAYLSPAVGSQFPLFPWMGFVLLGVGFGQLYARWGAAHLGNYANSALLAPGVVLVALAEIVRARSEAIFGSGPGGIVPGEVMLRIGASLILLAAIAHLSRRLAGLPHVFGAVAQESLLIYFVHLCLVYGSVWNLGLAQVYGSALNPVQTILCVLFVVGSMVALAWYWNWQKHVRPKTARLISFGAGGLLLYQLL